jgi:hypothetical protein
MGFQPVAIQRIRFLLAVRYGGGNMRRIITVFVILGLLSISMCLLVGADDKTPLYTINSVKAYLYHETDGSFSQDVFKMSPGSLWNTIIGEGASGGASHSTMVVVEVGGKPGSYISARKIQFTAFENGKVKMKRVTSMSVLSDSGKYFEAFWLYDTGCVPIKISAELLGQSKVSKLERTIGFSCGE